jgi:hypothetical protein
VRGAGVKLKLKEEFAGIAGAFNKKKKFSITFPTESPIGFLSEKKRKANVDIIADVYLRMLALSCSRVPLFQE